MQMLSVSKKNISKSMLSSLNSGISSKNTKHFEKETISQVLANKTIKKTMELLSKV